MVSSKPEVIFWPYYRSVELTHGLRALEFVAAIPIVEPDFNEPQLDCYTDPFNFDPLCEYCGKSKGYPTNLGIHVALLCDDCAVHCEDEIVYDISQL